MSVAITPDLPFKSGIKKVLKNTFAETTPFLLMMEIFRFDGQYMSLLSYLISFLEYLQNDFLYLAGIIFFAVLLKVWYVHNRMKNITSIEFDKTTDRVTVLYTNILGGKLRRETFRKNDLFISYNKKKAEAHFSPRLQEPYLLNKSTGFSPAKLLELENMYKQMVTST